MKFCTLAKTRKLWGLENGVPILQKICCFLWSCLNYFIAVLNFLSHLLFARPGSILARPLGGRSCNFSHQWGMSWPCFKDSTSKAYSFVQIWLRYHLGYKNCAVGLVACFGSSICNIQNYTLSIKSYFIQHFLPLPQLATMPQQTKLFIIPHNY